MVRFARRSTAKRADIGIDLGTANTLVVERGAGLIFDQPSVCCFKTYDAAPEFVAAGSEAQGFVGRIARPLKIVRPLRDGVLSDITAARELLKFATRAVRPAFRLARVHALIGVPADATQAERRALTTAATDAGLAEPQLLAEPLLSAIGVGLEIDEPRGRMIVDCGAGTTEVAMISLGDICFSHTVRGGGEGLDRALIDHLHLRHRFQIGSSTAERLKLELSSLLDSNLGEAELEVRGFDATMGVPKTITVPASELLTLWHRHTADVVAAVRTALGETSPELSKDVLEDGIVLTGGAAMTALLMQRIAEETGIPTRIANAPLRSVAKGLEKLLENPR